MNLYQQALAYRQQVLAGDSQAAIRILAAYKQAFDEIQVRLAAVLASGQGLTKTELVRLEQYRQLLAALDTASNTLAQRVGSLAVSQQTSAIHLANLHAQQLIMLAAGGNLLTFIQPAPIDALQSLVGAAGDGTPLNDLLLQNNYDAGKAAIAELVNGLVSGQDARRVAEAVKNAWGQSLTRSLSLVRTETMRAYREANRQAYLANSDVVKGWRWLSARNQRTCPACLALDGKVFKLEEPQPAHVRCRCTMVPVLRHYEQPQRQTGAEWFANQDEATKRKIIGDKGMAALDNGASLTDFLTWRHDDDWGKQALWSVPQY